jgi:DNA invertase Pin-like site-specific DNA recombinase
MFIRAYLRASTREQNAKRAKNELIAFASDHGHKIAAFYVENESGATLVRPQLMQLIEDAHEGDIILVEQIDRLARLNPADWDTLKRMLSEKKLSVVSKELPTSYMAFQADGSTEFMNSVLQAINAMMLDMLAAIARKDYEDRRHRQQQGIAKAQAKGKYLGRRKDTEKRKIIASLLKSGHSYSDIQKTAKC